MKVLKFGGSSVARPERIRQVIDILSDYYSKGEKFTVVFSAFGGITDSLISMSQLAASGDQSYLRQFDEFSQRHTEAVQSLLPKSAAAPVLKELKENHTVLKNLLYGILLVQEASPRTMDYVLSFGERNSAFIISHVLKQRGILAAYLDARQIIKTDCSFGTAKVDFETSYQNIRNHYAQSADIQIVTGFIASSSEGLTTTLGRGGSDYTAALLAAGLQAQLIEIWTDVDGVLTADPRKVSKAFTIGQMSFAEAMEMSHFGAKVIYPPTLQPALSLGIPLRIKNTFNPGFEGTHISTESHANGHPVKGISSISHIALLTLQGSGMFGVPGIAGRLFGSLAQANINIILITQGSSEHSISFAIQPENAQEAKQVIGQAFEYEMQSKFIEPLKVEENLSVVAAIGENMRYQPGIAGRMFQALGKNGVNCIAIAQGSSELNISVVIEGSDERKALNALHDAFFLSDTKELHLFMVGAGLIGSTLIRQICAQAAFLKEKRSLELKLIGLTNSRKMVFDENGMDWNDWKNTLDQSPEASNIAAFVSRMKEMNLSNTIFIDNTADQSVSSFYETILDASISISTPNKIAASAPFLRYQRLKTMAKKRGVQFRYETNVGAGLPVLSTLNDLINSGDQILKIEGVLSGSLSFIFNSFDGSKKFSEVISQAKELGLTEPDPRIDLLGIDVRRKLIILAREIGYPLEAEDVKVTHILPESCENAASVVEFFKEIKKQDAHFDALLEAASAENKALRMIAKMENGQADIGLAKVEADHPFYNLSGSDNMIVFTTERYKDRPLVIRGPGAGAEVTAAGVFAEIISIGNFLF